ncbi:hypothetical protein [Streptomyces sp. MCA2]|uniref:hypothetical protein n=1 Tax=Streptomyces sp. MCA2 TaxID=2944805 RepID=UPI0027E55914|nr:hypothetical protein [Streptomyces sp. MCA2]
MHIACEPCMTCRAVVADHHQPGPHRRPGTTGNAATGWSCSKRTATAASVQRRCTSVPSDPANSASTAPGSGTRQALGATAGKPDWALSWLLSKITYSTQRHTGHAAQANQPVTVNCAAGEAGWTARGQDAS